ncbi:NADH dehydrogenase [ubiquinone] 1 beta subcomplex subunit 5, mitochondrial-like [Centruroides sculpturatus]|uniref:NADH dehydrogenase [ubiquinone] 1 beta subcomplex subunit 5, mitochondrial-like n=1 Tax=Centruroides sculpturatus TaxID=218467 RepID=UPI000C6C9B94|nr:NADH dehydrogenase [ubiquinone] 1 beta subcomplex subunit 5, mitochondrial-like [Centruroides sculpturatus]
MAVLSVMCRNYGLKQPLKLLNSVLFRNIHTDKICRMSDKKIFHISPSKFQYEKFKDSLHFYFLLGAIPLGILIFCVNVFIGPAELAEIPEGYEPKHWEYFRHPIQRFFARYIYASPQQIYEKNMHALWEESEKVKWRKLERKVKSLMAERDDYRSWYFIPVEGKYHRYTLKEEHKVDQFKGYQL